MSTSLPDMRPQLAAAQQWVAEIIAQVPESALNLPTPCSEFTVRQLLGHLMFVQERIMILGRDHRDDRNSTMSAAEFAAAFADYLAEHIDGKTIEEITGNFSDNAREALTFWDDTRLPEPTDMPWGVTLPGNIAVAIYIFENLCHGWDLAVAIGVDAEADPALAESALATAKNGLPAEPRGMSYGVPFDPPVSPAANAGPTEQLANWLGRSSP